MCHFKPSVTIVFRTLLVSVRIRLKLSEYQQLQNNVPYIKWRIFKYGPVVLGIRAQCMLHIGPNGIIAF